MKHRVLLRRGRWLHGAEPLVAERERRGVFADVETLLEGLPAALFEAVTQREWEADVVWAAADSADAAATAVRVEEEEEEPEGKAAVDKPEGLVAAGAPRAGASSLCVTLFCHRPVDLSMWYRALWCESSTGVVLLLVAVSPAWQTSRVLCGSTCACGGVS